MSKGNLLLVDDETLLLERLELWLGDLADKVYTAENGLQALDVLEKNQIHCVVCDINMPKMNGVEVIKKVRELNNPVPIIFYTGHGNDELMLEVSKYGAFDFLNKPDMDGLEEVVTLGLKAGMKGPDDQNGSEEDNLSEYQKLLNGLKG